MAPAVASPDAWADSYRQLALFDFPADMRMGLMLSYYRNFAVPSIAQTLANAGGIATDPMKRSVDMALILFELIEASLEGPRADHLIGLLTRVHRNVTGGNDDYLYVLLSLLVVPIRWFQQHGWRALSAAEVEAATAFYRGLGHRMGLRGLPDSYEATDEFYARSELARVRPSDEGRAPTTMTISTIKSRMPGLIRPIAQPLLSTWIDDEAVTDAFGLPRGGRALRRVNDGVLRVRNATTRRRRRPITSPFQPGLSGSAQYPDGYEVPDLGPRAR
ncbi:oxygenase MpaB family protein [Rathayibacter rathayi]|uniref:oxygenase MpaB family protein n=1 Tax=Rathayibacter rathayi TaxID=33887 RepID=UPI0015E3C967|nr:oxygenase MpaB family protein [Rathayibacter rathayi]